MNLKPLAFVLLALSAIASAPALADRWDDQIVLTTNNSGKVQNSITFKDAEKGKATLDELKAALNEGEENKYGMLPCYRGQPKEVFEIVRALVENKDGNKVTKEEIEPYLDLFRDGDHEYNILTTYFTGKKGHSHAVVLIRCSENLKAKSGRSSAFYTFREDDGAGI